MGEYRYHLYDPNNHVIIDTLPFENVTFTQEVRGVGTFSGDVPLYADGLSAGRVLDATIPDRTKVFVERDGALVWGGRIVPGRDYDSATRHLTINATETLGVFELRFLPTLAFFGKDQMFIARQIFASLMATGGSGVDLLLDSTLMSGQLRDRAWNLGDRNTGLQALTDLSEQLGGFEFCTSVTWGSTGLPEETLLLAFPRLGRLRSSAAQVLEYDLFGTPGNVVSYTWSDGAGLFTRSWADTQTAEGVQLVAKQDNPTLLAAGYPMLEQAQSFTGIPSLAALVPHAKAMAAFSNGHRAVATFVVSAAPGMELGDWSLGDDVMVRISDWRFPPDPKTGAPGFADFMRIAGVSVSPQTGATPERYTFTMATFLEPI